MDEEVRRYPWLPEGDPGPGLVLDEFGLLNLGATQKLGHSKHASKFLKFRGVVESVAAMSKDPSTKVGAIALDDNFNIVATGFNGFPRGVDDSPERYADRAIKYKLVSHAEQNVVAQAAYGGRSLRGTTLLLTSLFPCSACAKSIIQSGIIRVISPPPSTDPRWAEEAEFAALMFREAGVEVVHYEK